MGRKWKRWYASVSTEPEIDLLSTAFGMPSRRDIERASQTSNPGRSAPCDFESESGSDENCDCVLIPDSDEEFVASSLDVSTAKSRQRVVDRPATPGPRSASRKRQHAQSRSSSLQSQRSILSKKAKGSIRHKVSPHDGKDQPLKSSLKGKKKASGSVPVSSYASSTQVESQTMPSAYSPQVWPQTMTNPYPPQVIPGCNLNPILHHVMPEPAPQSPFAYVQHQIPTAVPPYAVPHIFHQPSSPPATGSTGRGSETLSCQRGSNFQELPGLQTELDRLQHEILVNPNDAQLRSDQQRTQNKLNDILNSIVAHKTRGTEHALQTTENTLGDKMKSSEVARDQENGASIEARKLTKAGRSSASQERRDSSMYIAQDRSKSPSCTIQHHLCSGCGGVRSQTFHEKHPIGTRHKPVLNFCSSCRVGRLEKGIMDNYHFCFGCGKVRSKAFQKKHKPKPGQPLLPNYCACCVVEVRRKEDMNETSVVGMTLAGSSQFSERASNIADPISSTTRDSTSNGLPKLSLQTSTSRVKSSETRNIAKLRLENASHAKSISAPVSPAGPSPFYPGRRLGSAQRRAQRAPTPHSHDEYRENCVNTAAPGNYQEPYVEEEGSATEQTIPTSTCNNNAGCFQDQKPSEEDVSEKAQEGGEGELTARDQNFSTLHTPDAAYTRITGLYSTTSSCEKTVRCHPHGNSSTQESRPTMSEYSEHHLRDDTQSPTHEQSRFSKGVFGKKSAIEGHGISQTTRRRRSPLADFDTTDCSPFDIRQDEGLEPQPNFNEPSGPLPFSSSRGVFGRSCNLKQSHFSVFDYSWTDHSRSESRSPNLEEEEPTFTGREENRSQNKPSRLRQETSANFFFTSDSGSRQVPTDFKSHKPNDGIYSRSVFTDYSRSTYNPYYKPRHRPFCNTDDSEYCGSWDPKSNLRRNNETSKTYGSAQFDDRVPEPIVEEPASPPSSPIQRTKLLEFNIASESVQYKPGWDNDALSVKEADVQPFVSSETSGSKS